MSDLKEGGLALIIGYNNNPSNMGKIVELVKKAVYGETYGGGTYVGELTNPWIVEGAGITAMNILGELKNTGFTFVAPEHLMPINPEADPLETTQKESEHVR